MNDYTSTIENTCTHCGGAERTMDYLVCPCTEGLGELMDQLLNLTSYDEDEKPKKKRKKKGKR
jgi:hypothetical protein